jgi:hypothetical protein
VSRATCPVEYGVPIPPPNQRRTYFRYPFDTMSVGGSFLIPNPAEKSRVSAILASRKRSHGEEYIQRRISAGIRVWRVK